MATRIMAKLKFYFVSFVPHISQWWSRWIFIRNWSSVILESTFIFVSLAHHITLTVLVNFHKKLASSFGGEDLCVFILVFLLSVSMATWIMMNLKIRSLVCSPYHTNASDEVSFSSELYLSESMYFGLGTLIVSDTSFLTLLYLYRWNVTL